GKEVRWSVLRFTTWNSFRRLHIPQKQQNVTEMRLSLRVVDEVFRLNPIHNAQRRTVSPDIQRGSPCDVLTNGLMKRTSRNGDTRVERVDVVFEILIVSLADSVVRFSGSYGICD